jgi:hypothetical protein
VLEISAPIGPEPAAGVDGRPAIASHAAVPGQRQKVLVEQIGEVARG